MEILFWTLRLLSRFSATKTGRIHLAIIKSWPVKWIHSSDELCLSAGMLKAQYRISFADAFIAATAIHADALLIHKDPEFETLKAILRMEILPYKHGVKK